MLRIRLHGRGGQGIKTASQILGTAAFLSGYQAQDFPLYGAERRGAPIIAFSRINSDPILERGPILLPDLLLIADETLLEDAQAAPLCGSDSETVVFVNSAKTPENLKEKFSLPSLPVTCKLTELCLKHLKNGMLRSTALAAAGVRLTGLIPFENLMESVEIELEAMGITGQPLKNNLELAQEIFEKLNPRTIKDREERPLSPTKLMIMEQRDVKDAAPFITATGNMAQRKTGNWRIHRPEIDYGECNHCMICYARCPEGVITMDTEGKPVIDYDHCKGCMICAQECPKHSIKTLWEMDHELEPQ